LPPRLTTYAFLLLLFCAGKRSHNDPKLRCKHADETVALALLLGGPSNIDHCDIKFIHIDTLSLLG